MPWTPAHPAFALPFFGLSKRPFVLAALIIGSMAPDIPYFVLLRFVSWGHMFPTLFLWGIPVLLVLAYIWIEYVREPFMRAIPFKGRKEISLQNLGWRDLLLGALMATIGILTHVGVDGFTHADGYAVALIPLLKGEVSLFGRSMPIWHLLQYALTLTGLILLMGYGATHTERRPFNPSAASFWTRAVVIGVVFGAVVGALRYPFEAMTVPGLIAIAATVVGIGCAALSDRGSPR